MYTPFHGAGYRLVPEILRRLGYKHIICEPEQMKIDGDFPTVKNPNPEYKEGFYLAIDLAKKNDVDLIIGTDPDADRTGIVLKDKSGEYVTLSGNQVGVLLTDYIITCALGKEIVRVDGLDEILAEVKAQGRNLNQLTTLANMGRIQILRSDELIDGYADLCQKLLRISREVQ